MTLQKDSVRQDAQRACAIVYGRGAGMSLLQLFQLVLDEGMMPSRAERERLLQERLAGDNTTPSSSPESVDRRDAPDASA